MLILCGSVSKNNIDSFWKLDKKEVKDAGKELAAKNRDKYYENQKKKFFFHQLLHRRGLR